MKTEYDKLCEMLADIRGNLKDEDFIDDEGYDRLSACVGSPVEVLAVLEMKLKRLEDEKKALKEQYNNDCNQLYTENLYLKNGLKYYANEKRYVKEEHELLGGLASEIEFDEGLMARSILSGLK